MRSLLAAAFVACALPVCAQNAISRGAASFPVPHTGVGGNGIARLAAEAPVSGLSPFASGCGLGTGTLYLHGEVEPSLAVNPTNDRHWIAAWQQDRWSNGSARGLVAAATFDAGATWTRVAPRLTVCSGGTYQRASDPWVSFSPDGTAWLVALVTVGNSVNAIVVSSSHDGGVTWSAPVPVISDTGTAIFNDKEAVTADPLDARFVYVVWDRLQQGTRGPTFFARTTDGGATWEAARAIHDPGAGHQTIGNLIRVLPDGTLVNLFTHIVGTGADEDGIDKDAPKDASLEVIRSTDRGLTWSAPIRVADYRAAGARDPSSLAPIRDGTPIAGIAVAPDGSLYVAWQDARMSPDPTRDDILLARSIDGGRTWASPVRVNPVPGKSAFAPQIHVAADGTIGITYYDLRSDTPAAENLLADFWIARSRDGGSTWTETHVAGPFDLLTAPFAGGYFLGDYTGLASAGGDFLALHARPTGSPDNPSDVFLTRVPATAGGLAYTADEAKSLRDDADLRRRTAIALRRALELRLQR